MSLDFTKPVQTRDGRKVRIYTTDHPGARPVVGAMGSSVYFWTSDGSIYMDKTQSLLDLVNTPPEPLVRYVNVYKNGDRTWSGDHYLTEEAATRAGVKSRDLYLTTLRIEFTPKEVT